MLLLLLLPVFDCYGYMCLLLLLPCVVAVTAACVVAFIVGSVAAATSACVVAATVACV